MCTLTYVQFPRCGCCPRRREVETCDKRIGLSPRDRKEREDKLKGKPILHCPNAPDRRFEIKEGIKCPRCLAKENDGAVLENDEFIYVADIGQER